MEADMASRTGVERGRLGVCFGRMLTRLVSTTLGSGTGMSCCRVSIARQRGVGIFSSVTLVPCCFNLYYISVLKDPCQVISRGRAAELEMGHQNSMIRRWHNSPRCFKVPYVCQVEALPRLWRSYFDDQNKYLPSSNALLPKLAKSVMAGIIYDYLVAFGAS